MAITLIAQALDLLEAEQEWLEISKSAPNQRLEQSMAQIDRGEGIPGDQLPQVLAERRQAQSEVSHGQSGQSGDMAIGGHDTYYPSIRKGMRSRVP